MNSLIENISPWLESLSPTMIFVIVIWLITIVAFRKEIAAKIKSVDFKKIRILKRKKELKKISLLENHDIFNVIERVRLDTKYKKFYTSGEFDLVKTGMFVNFINFYLDSIRKNYKEYFKNEDLILKNNDQLKASVLKLINLTEKETADNTRKYFLKKGLNKEDTDYVIELFEVWRNDTSKAVSFRIEAIFSSTFHFDNFDKLLGCMEIISMSIDLIPKDGTESFEKMNGRFKDIKY